MSHIYALDDDGNSIPVHCDDSGKLYANIGAAEISLSVNLSAADDNVLVYGFDGADNQKIKTDVDGHLQVDVLTNVLPSGASTLTEQQSQTTKLTSIDGKITSCDTGNVVVSSSALPTGAATLAEQQTQSTSLSTIVSNTTPLSTLTTTTVGSDVGLDVNIIGGVSLSVNLSESGDSILVYGNDGTTNRAVKTDADGHLQVDVLTNVLPSGAATLTEQQSQTTKLTSIDGKITACDTSAVAILSSALPSGASTLAEQQSQTTKLTSIDGKITTCDTSAVAILSSALPSGAATETTLSTLNGKVTACDTGNVTVGASVLPTGAATETTLSTLNGKITACNTGSVVVSSSALPTGAATETTLSTLNGKVTACDTGNVTVVSTVLPTDAATETTLAAVEAKLTSDPSTATNQATQSGLLTSVDKRTTSMRDIIGGARNGYERHMRILTASGTISYLSSSPLLTSIPAKPAGNVKVRVSSTNAGDTAHIVIKGVDNSGEAVQYELDLNGTSYVYIDSGSTTGTGVIGNATKSMVFVNDVTPAVSTAGSIFVYLDYADNDFVSGVFNIGRVSGLGGMHLETTFHLAPNGRQACMLSSIMTVESTSSVMYYTCKSPDWWTSGSAIAASDIRNSGTMKVQYLSTNNVNVEMGDETMVANPLELIVCVGATAGATTKYGSCRIVEYDL